MKNINIRKLFYHVKHRYATMNNMVMVVALVVGAGWAWASVGAMQRNYGLQKEVDSKNQDLQLMELETQNLAFEQKYYKSSEYQELAVRERLGLVRPGEKVLSLPPNSDAATARSSICGQNRGRTNFAGKSGNITATLL